MTAEAMTVHIPDVLYARLQERARQTQRSIEEELVEALAEAVSLEDAPLPSDVTNALGSLRTMPDDALWQTARASHLSPAAAAHLEELNQKRQRESLTIEEHHVAEALLHQYERAMLVRAAAMALLKERGLDISDLLEPDTA